MDVPRYPAQKRRPGKYNVAPEENPPVPDPVAQLAEKQQGCCARKQIGEDYPRYNGGARMEIPGDRGQGDIDDRAVQLPHKGRKDNTGKDQNMTGPFIVLKRLVYIHIRPHDKNRSWEYSAAIVLLCQ